jgi:hypothetical protein
MSGKKPYFLLIIFLFLLVASVYFRAINPDRFGFYHDDGIYLVTAKALASDHEYKIVSLPDEPWQTKYPPLYPLALSVLWRANPDFPGNLILFFSFSILCMLVFHALTAFYLLKKSFAGSIQVLLILILTAFNWRVIILATSILSEALYAALALCVLWLASSRGKKAVGRKGLWPGILLALLLVLATLTRLAGISLLAAVLLYALAKREGRRFLLPIVLSVSIIAGWFLWCYLHQSSSIGTHIAYYTNYLQDWHSLIRSDEPGVQGSFLVPIASMVWKNAVTMLSTIPLLCFGMEINKVQTIPEIWQFPAILIGLSSLILLVIGFYKTRSVENGLLHYYILAYLAMHLLWPYTIFDRFLIPILPFLLLFILSGAAAMLSGLLEGTPIHKRRERVIRLVLFCTFLASLFVTACLGLAIGLRDQLKYAKTRYEAEAQQKRELTAWLKANSREGDILVCYQDPVYFLNTGIKAIRLPAPTQREPSMSYADRLQRFIKENKASLLLETANDFSLESYNANKRTILAEVLNDRPAFFAPIYSSLSRKGNLFRITPDKKSKAK